ncbi:MAG: hypothetical protein FWE07_02345 [Turicibacter sp.]|nr:hypothetical protein [Turicibacter sp.]
MLTTFVTSGNFQEVRIPQMILRRAGIDDQEMIDLTVEDGKIIVEKSKTAQENRAFLMKKIA